MKPVSRVFTAVVFGLGMLVLPGSATATPRSCASAAAPLTVEELRLSQAAPAEILRRSRFDRFAERFVPSLCRLRNADEAELFVRAEGQQLWDAAVERAQSRKPKGDLPAADDRPLYWARLQLTRALRQWTPSFELGADRREALIDTLDGASRGHDSIVYPDAMQRILITGFDPFLLDFDIRQSNPSGASVLALDGTTVRTATGFARIEAVVFPVLWDPFAEGVVEHALLPHLADVDLFATISQGRPGRFDLERFNGRWRGGFIDNDNITSLGVIPIPDGVPTIDPAPEFVSTTLPSAAIVAVTTGRFPVFDNTSVDEIPAGASDPVTQPDGPTPGSTARAGGGGDYLSNEIAYRVTLLRDALGLDIPGGHVHTPVLRFGAGNTTELTDPTFETNLSDIVDQVRAILTVAAS